MKRFETTVTLTNGNDLIKFVSQTYEPIGKLDKEAFGQSCESLLISQTAFLAKTFGYAKVGFIGQQIQETTLWADGVDTGCPDMRDMVQDVLDKMVLSIVTVEQDVE